MPKLTSPDWLGQQPTRPSVAIQPAGLSEWVSLAGRGRAGIAAYDCFVERHVESPVVQRSDDVMSGTPVFAGTKVPVKTLFAYLVAGETLDRFLKDFPSVSRRQALSLLRDAEAAMTEFL